MILLNPQLWITVLIASAVMLFRAAMFKNDLEDEDLYSDRYLAYAEECRVLLGRVGRCGAAVSIPMLALHLVLT